MHAYVKETVFNCVKPCVLLVLEVWRYSHNDCIVAEMLIHMLTICHQTDLHLWVLNSLQVQSLI